VIKIPSHIKKLQPYTAGKPIEELARERGLTRIVKLASNENALGISPLALQAIKKSLQQSYRYVDPRAFELTSALSQKLGIPASRVICGAGADSLLSYIIVTFSSSDDELLTSQGTFIGIYVNAAKQNRRVALVPLKDYGYDLGAILKRINDNTRIIYLANPNNPTGTIFSGTEFEDFMAEVPSDILVILDEAYSSYAAHYADYPNGLQYDYENLIVTRTFSKDSGLAGLRVGYAVGPEPLIHELYKVKLPFEPSYPAVKAATAALEDQTFLDLSVAQNNRSMERLTGALDRLELRWIPSHANFVLLLMESEDEAARFAELCLNRGLILRHVKAFGIPKGIRISCGTDSEIEFAADQIESVLNELRPQKSHAAAAVRNTQG
jgi:histidinol-phosphate aminotransferase